MGKMGKMGWAITAVVAIVIDIVQFLIGFFGAWLSVFVIGAFLVAANEVADPFIGGLAAAYFSMRGISMIKHWDRLLSLLCVAGVDELTGGMASFWIIDVWYIWKSVKREEAELQAAKEQTEFMQSNIRQPMNQMGPDGKAIRMPTNEHIAPAPSRARYFNEVGRPTA
jgi:hypothetical protein